MNKEKKLKIIIGAIIMIALFWIWQNYKIIDNLKDDNYKLGYKVSDYQKALKEANNNIKEANLQIKTAKNYAGGYYEDMTYALESMSTVETISEPYKNTSLDLKGEYFFGECYGKTLSGNGICFEFNIEILTSQSDTIARYSIDGNQTLRRLLCDIRIRDDKIEFLFNSYDSKDIHPTEDLRKGEKLFDLTKKGEKYYFSHFKSPVDGELIETEYELLKRPSND